MKTEFTDPESSQTTVSKTALTGKKTLAASLKSSLNRSVKASRKTVVNKNSSAIKSQSQDSTSDSSTKDGMGIGALCMTLKWVAKNRKKSLPPSKFG